MNEEKKTKAKTINTATAAAVGAVVGVAGGIAVARYFSDPGNQKKVKEKFDTLKKQAQQKWQEINDENEKMVKEKTNKILDKSEEAIEKGRKQLD